MASAGSGPPKTLISDCGIPLTARSIRGKMARGCGLFPLSECTMTRDEEIADRVRQIVYDLWALSETRLDMDGTRILSEIIKDAEILDGIIGLPVYRLHEENELVPV